MDVKLMMMMMMMMMNYLFFISTCAADHIRQRPFVRSEPQSCQFRRCKHDERLGAPGQYLPSKQNGIGQRGVPDRTDCTDYSETSTDSIQPCRKNELEI